MSWFTESNRWKHFVYAIPVGYVFTILCVLGLATGMEFKDKLWGGKYDWIDWLATMLGGLIGQALQILTIYLITFEQVYPWNDELKNLYKIFITRKNLVNGNVFLDLDFDERQNDIFYIKCILDDIKINGKLGCWPRGQAQVYMVIVVQK